MSQSVFPNTLHNTIKSKAWRALHAVIGDYTMFYILRHMFVFQHLHNGCLLQVSRNTQPATHCQP